MPQTIDLPRINILKLGEAIARGQGSAKMEYGGHTYTFKFSKHRTEGRVTASRIGTDWEDKDWVVTKLYSSGRALGYMLDDLCLHVQGDADRIAAVTELEVYLADNGVFDEEDLLKLRDEAKLSPRIDLMDANQARSWIEFLKAKNTTQTKGTI